MVRNVEEVVSVPVDWDELDRPSGPKDFTVAEVPLRVRRQGLGRVEASSLSR
jgi:DNA primase